MSWLDLAAGTIAGGAINQCQSAHPHHLSKVVDIALDGETLVPHYPAFPSAVHFEMRVWDWESYQGVGGYCSGQDEVSKSIDLQGVWEGYETRLALEILRGPEPGVVLDFGAHLGWYTLLAALADRFVMAIEADPESLALVVDNASINGLADLVIPVAAWIGEATNVIPLPTDGERVRLLKSDLEGSEDEVLRICEPLLAAGLVDYALFEISPVFKDHYPDTVERIVNFGYRVYLVPDENPGPFSIDPFAALEGYRLDGPELRERIAAFHQRNVLFVKEA